MNKPWYKSKTKIGSLLMGLGVAAVSPEVASAIPEIKQFAPLLQVLGVTLAGFGVRDALPKG